LDLFFVVSFHSNSKHFCFLLFLFQADIIDITNEQIQGEQQWQQAQNIIEQQENRYDGYTPVILRFEIVIGIKHDKLKRVINAMVSSFTTIAELKDIIEAETINEENPAGLARDNYRLVFKEKEMLHDWETLGRLEMKAWDTVWVVLKLSGGGTGKVTKKDSVRDMRLSANDRFANKSKITHLAAQNCFIIAEEFFNASSVKPRAAIMELLKKHNSESLKEVKSKVTASNNADARICKIKKTNNKQTNTQQHMQDESDMRAALCRDHWPRFQVP
jgi:hypothetical protein